MADDFSRDNPSRNFFKALDELISEKRTNPLADLDLETPESSFVEGLKSVVSDIDKLINSLEGFRVSEDLSNLARRIAVARIPTGDKEKLEDFLQSITKYSNVILELSQLASESFDEELSKRIRESIKFLVEDFETLKRRGGKNLTELFEQIEKATSYYTQDPLRGNRFFGVDPNLLSKFFYIANLEENRYREAAFLLSRKDYFEKPEAYTALFGSSTPINALTKQLSDTVSTFTTATKVLEESSRTTRLFDPNIPYVRELQRDRLNRIPGEIAYARRFINSAIEELEKKITELESTPAEKRDYESLAKYVVEKETLQEKLLELTKQEIALREEIQRKTYGMLIDATKAYASRAVDRTFSLTRNPFVDIFTDSIKFAFQIGSSVYLGTRNLLDFGGNPFSVLPPIFPRGGGSYPLPSDPRRGGSRPLPTAGSDEKPTTQQQSPTVPIPGQNTVSESRKPETTQTKPIYTSTTTLPKQPEPPKPVVTPTKLPSQERTFTTTTSPVDVFSPQTHSRPPTYSTQIPSTKPEPFSGTTRTLDHTSGPIPILEKVKPSPTPTTTTQLPQLGPSTASSSPESILKHLGPTSIADSQQRLANLQQLVILL
jgi:hypothetical protein